MGLVPWGPLGPECSPCHTGTWRSEETHAVEAPTPWLQVLGSLASCRQPGTSMSRERWRQHAGLPKNHLPPHVSGRLVSGALAWPLPADWDVLVGLQASPARGGRDACWFCAGQTSACSGDSSHSSGSDLGTLTSEPASLAALAHARVPLPATGPGPPSANQVCLALCCYNFKHVSSGFQNIFSSQKKWGDIAT